MAEDILEPGGGDTYSAPTIDELLPASEAPAEVSAPVDQTEAAVDAGRSGEQWDHAKAETLAHYANDTGIIDKALTTRDQVVDSINEPGYRDHLLKREASESIQSKERLESRVRAEQLETDQDEARLAELRDELSRVSSELTKVADRIDHDIQSRLEKANNDVISNIDEPLVMPEKLYDQNAELFSTMPTREFIAVTKEAERLINDLKLAKEAIGIYRDYQSTLNSLRQEKKSIPYKYIEDLMTQISASIPEKYEELKKQFDELKAAEYETSQSDMMLGYIGIAKNAEEAVVSVLETAQRAVAHFKDKYKLTQTVKTQQLTS